ncbi:hypothetical protein PINS_up024446 [Pythium insidiosum]|nr:hypothetical protein PINS_up024446 [Pythium insidiosum]
MALFSNDAWSPRGDSSRGSQSIVAQLERMNVQCPVQLHALRFRRNRHDEVQFDQVPHVFPSCGHVFGFDARLADTRLCPLCRTPGHLVPLLLKENSPAALASRAHDDPRVRAQSLRPRDQQEARDAVCRAAHAQRPLDLSVLRRPSRPLDAVLSSLSLQRRRVIVESMNDCLVPCNSLVSAVL